MTKNPLANALLAAAYIVLVACLMFYGPGLIETPEDSVIAPIAMLSLLVLSAALMGFLFFFQPICLYLDGSRTEAVRLIGRTIAIFAGLTILFFLGLFLFK